MYPTHAVLDSSYQPKLVSQLSVLLLIISSFLYYPLLAASFICFHGAKPQILLYSRAGAPMRFNAKTFWCIALKNQNTEIDWRRCKTSLTALVRLNGLCFDHLLRKYSSIIEATKDVFLSLEILQRLSYYSSFRKVHVVAKICGFLSTYKFISIHTINKIQY